MTAPPLSALQIRIFVLCALIVLLDGYDLQAMGLAVPALGKQWHLAPSSFTIAQSASLLGLGLGSAYIAPLGDRLGRRPLLLAGLAIILLTSLGAATATSTGQLAVWRLLVGLGLGVGLGQCLRTDGRVRAAGAARATIMTLMGVCVALGGVLAGLTAPQVDCCGRCAGTVRWLAAALPLLALLAAAAGACANPPQSATTPPAANEWRDLARIAAAAAYSANGHCGCGWSMACRQCCFTSCSAGCRCS